MPGSVSRAHTCGTSNWWLTPKGISQMDSAWCTLCCVHVSCFCWLIAWLQAECWAKVICVWTASIVPNLESINDIESPGLFVHLSFGQRVCKPCMSQIRHWPNLLKTKITFSGNFLNETTLTDWLESPAKGNSNQSINYFLSDQFGRQQEMLSG